MSRLQCRRQRKAALKKRSCLDHGRDCATRKGCPGEEGELPRREPQGWCAKAPRAALPFRQPRRAEEVGFVDGPRVRDLSSQVLRPPWGRSVQSRSPDAEVPESKGGQVWERNWISSGSVPRPIVSRSQGASFRRLP